MCRALIFPAVLA